MRHGCLRFGMQPAHLARAEVANATRASWREAKRAGWPAPGV